MADAVRNLQLAPRVVVDVFHQPKFDALLFAQHHLDGHSWYNGKKLETSEIVLELFEAFERAHERALAHNQRGQLILLTLNI